MAPLKFILLCICFGLVASSADAEGGSVLPLSKQSDQISAGSLIYKFIDDLFTLRKEIVRVKNQNQNLVSKVASLKDTSSKLENEVQRLKNREQESKGRHSFFLYFCTLLTSTHVYFNIIPVVF